MRRRTRLGVLLLAAVTVLAVAQSSFGAGFALYEGSARGNALGGAMVGRADDPSALFYNPAGITQLPGIQFMSGATFIMPTTDVHTFVNGVETVSGAVDNLWFPPHIYATYQYNDSLFFGLAVFSPFGLGTEFDEGWPGRYNNYKAVIQTLTINPNVAYKITDRLSVAAGLDAMYFDLTLKQKLNSGSALGRAPLPAAFDINSSLTGDSWGYGWNAALHYRAFDWLSLGLSYRSQVKQHLKGQADFTKPLVSVVPTTWFNDTGVSGAVSLPAELYLGATFKPMDRLSWEVGAIFTQWSSYRELVINYQAPIIYLPYYPYTVSQSRSTKNWKDVWRFNTGVEYKALPWLDLRVGYVYDQEPTSAQYLDYLVPANDRHMFAGGVGFRWDKWTLDVSYTYLIIENRDVFDSLARGVLDSTFRDGNAHLIGVSVGYKF